MGTVPRRRGRNRSSIPFHPSNANVLQKSAFRGAIINNAVYVGRDQYNHVQNYITLNREVDTVPEQMAQILHNQHRQLVEIRVIGVCILFCRALTSTHVAMESLPWMNYSGYNIQGSDSISTCAEEAGRTFKVVRCNKMQQDAIFVSQAYRLRTYDQSVVFIDFE